MDDPQTPSLPERVAGLSDIARNLRWSWSRKSRRLFRTIDPTLWHLTRHNPIELLRRVDPARLAQCASDAEYLALYDAVVARAQREATNADTWFSANYPQGFSGPVAYFCAEFGLHNSVPIYSGGLGILAGDHCKGASDLGIPLIGVGLLYTRGYFDQRLRLDGWQEDADEEFDPTLTPLERVLDQDGDPCLTVVHTASRGVAIGAWRMMVGRVPIYLLDTDFEENDPADRGLTHRLYVGHPELRLRQEWVLGVGGVRVLRALGNNPAVWHANEGHAAFMLLERLRELRARGVGYDEAAQEVRRSSLFTTHTPVPAGHDAFSLQQIEQIIGPIWEEMGLSRERVLHLGSHPVRDHGQFHMPVLAIRLSRYVNGVSQRHEEVSRRIWADLWPGRELSQIPIGHVTNAVHVSTWMSHHMSRLFNAQLGDDWGLHVDEPEFWSRVQSIDPARLWDTHMRLKSALMRALREEARRRWADHWKEALHLVGAGTLLDEQVLTIGFARRFATYKRADLIFRDLDRLQRLLTNPWRPVQLVYAGKAHPADDPGKKILQNVYAHTREARFEGRIAFVEDYEMHLAHRLVQGVDLWLNLPRVPLEASGTSGMKAALNGVPQISTLDGWWCEAYNERNGWALTPFPEPDDLEKADAADAEQLYRLLEEKVVPLFYARDARDVPLGWVDMMKQSIQVAGERFNARRMLRDYVSQYYLPAMQADGGSDDPPTA